MVHKVEKLENHKYDFLLNESLYFSIIGEDKETGEMIVNHICKDLTNQESQELITEFINESLATMVAKLVQNDPKI